jgi:hypothetical protein
MSTATINAAKPRFQISGEFQNICDQLGAAVRVTLIGPQPWRTKLIAPIKLNKPSFHKLTAICDNLPAG